MFFYRCRSSAKPISSERRCGRIGIGLSVRDTHGAQYGLSLRTILATRRPNYSNNQQLVRHPRHGNLWLEESFETGFFCSLYALMSRSGGQLHSVQPAWQGLRSGFNDYVEKRTGV